MQIFDGVVTLADADVPVIVGLTDGSLRLSSNGEDIGEWVSGEFAVSRLDDGAFAIRAESDVLRFVPSEPDRFASSVNGQPGGASSADMPLLHGRHEPPQETPLVSSRPLVVAEPVSPGTATPEAPGLMTMVGFYGLVALTAGLGLWALFNMIF